MSTSQKILSGAGKVAQAAYVTLKYLLSFAAAGFVSVVVFSYVAPIIAGWLAAMAAGTVLTVLMYGLGYALAGGAGIIAGGLVSAALEGIKYGVNYLRGLWTARKEAKVVRAAAAPAAADTVDAAPASKTDAPEAAAA